MKILWVKHGKLFPVDAGGKIRTYNILRHLASRHDVTFISSYSGEKDPAYEAELHGQFQACFSICTGAPEDSDAFGSRARHYLARAAMPAPYAVTKFTSPVVRRIVREKLDGREFDVAVCDFLAVSLDFPMVLKTPTVLFQHNVETLLWERQARCEGQWLKKMIFTLEAAKMKRYEKAAVRRFHHVIAVSESDGRIMSETAPGRVTVVPTGVDLSQFQRARSAPVTNSTVAFLGSMDWEANIDGVQHFCGSIWPKVLAAVPGAKFMIIGRNPHPNIQRLASSSVTVTGTVPSVVEYLKNSAMVVVPLRIGGGTRLKIYEAMAAGKPVVSTPIGAEGLDVEDGTDIVLAEGPSNFADCVIRLLRDESLCARIAQAAIRKASRYDWSEVSVRFENVLAAVAGISLPGQDAI